MKHVGDLPAAALLADEARSMDLADRFLNSECVKRMLQSDQVRIAFIFSSQKQTIFQLPTSFQFFFPKVGPAEKTAVLFTKDGDQHNNLHDMQCMWYFLLS